MTMQKNIKLHIKKTNQYFKNPQKIFFLHFRSTKLLTNHIYFDNLASYLSSVVFVTNNCLGNKIWYPEQVLQVSSGSFHKFSTKLKRSPNEEFTNLERKLSLM